MAKTYKVTAKGKTFVKEARALRGSNFRLGSGDRQTPLVANIRAIIVATDILSSGGGNNTNATSERIKFHTGRSKGSANKAFLAAKNRGFIS